MKKILSILMILTLLIPLVYAAEGPDDDIDRAEELPEDVTSSFFKFGLFLDKLNISLALPAAFLGLVLVFFALIALMGWLPIKLYPVYIKYQNIIKMLFKVVK